MAAVDLERLMLFTDAAGRRDLSGLDEAAGLVEQQLYQEHRRRFRPCNGLLVAADPAEVELHPLDDPILVGLKEWERPGKNIAGSGTGWR
jgi:hypothetical protein